MKPIVDRLEETCGDEFNVVRIDTDRPNGVQLIREHSLVGQPSYIFFNRENEVTRRMTGPQSFDTLAQEIERILPK